MKDTLEERSVTLDERAVRRVTRLFGQALTAQEISLLSRFPLRSAELVSIKERAIHESHRAYLDNRAVPEDAYRHVLWSYLLTRKFGESFAKLVTDAHENEGASDNDNDADHRMDLANNAAGRSYAARGVGEDQILQTLMSDRTVVRRPLK
jgi:hypothetical protein